MTPTTAPTPKPLESASVFPRQRSVADDYFDDEEESFWKAPAAQAAEPVSAIPESRPAAPAKKAPKKPAKKAPKKKAAPKKATKKPAKTAPKKAPKKKAAAPKKATKKAPKKAAKKPPAKNKKLH